MGSGGSWPLGTHSGHQGIRECDLHSGPWKGLFTGACGPFSCAFFTNACRWREGRYLGGFWLGVSSCPVLGKTCGKGVAETNRLCVSRGGLMFMGSGPLAQHISFPPARLQASLWLGPRQVAQQRLSQVGLGVAVPSSQNWAPAQAPMDGSPLLLLDRLLGLLLPLLLPPSRRPLRLCPTPLLLHLSWELSLDLCLWAPGTPWWDTWWSREESPKAV